MGVIKLVPYILSLAVVFVMPYIAHAVAIVIGYPFTQLMRKVTYSKLPFNYRQPEYTLDIYFLQLLANFLDGLFCLVVAYTFFHWVFQQDMLQNRTIIYLIALLKGYNIYRKEDLAHARTNEFVWEIVGFLAFVIGIVAGTQIFHLF